MVATTVHAEVRRPAVAGAFYPDAPDRLRTEVRRFLALEPSRPASGTRPAAIVAPHAGYIYSGATAGRAFAGLVGARAGRVVLLGPSHHAGFRGAALPPVEVEAFATPLGEVPVDRLAVDRLRAFPEFAGPGAAHGPEHCLEVELPFLQETVGAAPIVPVLVGAGTDAETTRAIARRLALLLETDTVVVVSSDFTHHGRAYGYAPFPLGPSLGPRLVDVARATAERAAAGDARGFWHQVETSGDTVCGARPVAILAELAARAFRGHGRVVDVTTSAAVGGTWQQVVTYAGIAFEGAWVPWSSEPPAPRPAALDADDTTAVLALVRATLATYLRHDASLARWFASHTPSQRLLAPAGLFVTVHNLPPHAHHHGRLRGCIGTMEPREPLVDALIHGAISAAHDPRFPPLQEDELGRVAFEVSVLSPAQPIPGPEAIVPGTHGVVLSRGERRAVFLPQVATEMGWDVESLLAHLARKAGLPGDDWRGAALEVFTAQVFAEPE